MRKRLLLRWFGAIGVGLAGTSAAFVGCSGDDTMTITGPGADASTYDVVTIDAAPKDAAAQADANDGATLCTSAPDAAMYDPGSIDAGGQLVEAWGCHGCHTADLSGNPSGIGFAYPKNLTPDLVTGLGCWTDDEIARAVLTGIDDEGEQLCVMPKFEGSIDDAGIAEIVAYLRSIRAVSKVIPETTCASTDAGIDAD